MWNGRGAANQDFRQAFKDMVEFHKPSIVILTETKLAGDRASEVIESMGFNHHAITNSKEILEEYVFCGART